MRQKARGIQQPVEATANRRPWRSKPAQCGTHKGRSGIAWAAGCWGAKRSAVRAKTSVNRARKVETKGLAAQHDRRDPATRPGTLRPAALQRNRCRPLAASHIELRTAGTQRLLTVAGGECIHAA